MRITGIIRVLSESPSTDARTVLEGQPAQASDRAIHLPEPPSSKPRSAPSVRDELEKTVRDLARDEAQKEITDQVRVATRGRRRF
jgi:hypothetical protein